MNNAVKASTLNVRITADMRQRLEAAANANGRSVSQEVETRLARTFSAEPNLGGQRQAFLLEDMAAMMNSASMALGKPWHLKDLGWRIVRDSWLHLIGLIEPESPIDLEREMSTDGLAELNRWRKETEPKRQAILDRMRELEQLKLKRSAFMLDSSEQIRLELLEILPEPDGPSLPDLNQQDLELWHQTESRRILAQRLWESVAPILRQGQARIQRERDEWDGE